MKKTVLSMEKAFKKQYAHIYICIFEAKGVSIENFKKNQEEIFGRYDSGFFGYRGLQGDIYFMIKYKYGEISKTTFKIFHHGSKLLHG